MNIYIKTFNRPFYLERCLKSILFNVSNYNDIIILDDGTYNNYKKKIIEKYPFIKWISNSSSEKYDLVKAGNTKRAKEIYADPAIFWLNETQKDSKKYFLLIEDDTWFVNMIDLLDFESVMTNENAVICKLFWGDYNREDRKYITRQYKLWNNLSIDIFNPNIQNIGDVYKIYIVAMAIFRKDYYANAIKKVNHFADETTQITESLIFYNNNPNVSYCKTNERIIYQGWATSVRHDDAITVDVGISSFEFVDILNEAWFKGKLDISENYPYDYDLEMIISLFKEFNLNVNHLNTYIDWRTKPQLNPTTLFYN